MNNFPTKLSFLAAACLLVNASSYGGRMSEYSNGYSRKRTEQLFPLTPRLTVDGASGGHAISFIYGDGMLPVMGNSDGIVFVDATGKGGTDKGWLAALGGGFREIWRGAIFGGYVFGERDRTSLADSFWMVNPGVEVMTPHWDVHVNGYIPAGSRENVLFTQFANQLGFTNFPTVFRGRQQFNEAFNFSNQIAPGMDGEIGYLIPRQKGVRAFAGGYTYWFNHAPKITGVELGLEIPLTQTFKLLFRDTYDNFARNTAVFTLRLNLGGITKYDENDIHERMLDIIPRHVGVIYTGSGIPTQQNLYDTGEMQVERDNIWFFGPGANTNAVGPYSCTYENPCSTGQFTQGNIAAIKGISPDEANFYLTSGNYLTGGITLEPGQSIWGRTSNYTMAGNASNYPTIYGNISLRGNNVLQSLQIYNQTRPNGPSADLPMGIFVGGSSVVMDQVAVGPSMPMEILAPVPIGTFAEGIRVSNAQNVLIQNSVINAADVETERTANAIGLSISDGSMLDLLESTVNVRTRQTSFSTPNNIESLGTGIYVASSDALFIQNTINVVGDATVVSNETYGPSLIVDQAGIQAQGDQADQSTVVLSSNNEFNITGYANSSSTQKVTPTVSNMGLLAQAHGSNAEIIISSEGDTINIVSRAVNRISNAGATVRNNAGFFSLTDSAAANSIAEIFIENAKINLNLTANTNSGNSFIGNIAGVYTSTYASNSISVLNTSNTNVAINAQNTSVSGTATTGNIVAAGGTTQAPNTSTIISSGNSSGIINNNGSNTKVSSSPGSSVSGETPFIKTPAGAAVVTSAIVAGVAVTTAVIGTGLIGGGALLAAGSGALGAAVAGAAFPGIAFVAGGVIGAVGIGIAAVGVAAVALGAVALAGAAIASTALAIVLVVKAAPPPTPPVQSFNPPVIPNVNTFYFRTPSLF